jgi:CRISPR/Cas system-associated protein Cas7 (RAMP superfamily)
MLVRDKINNEAFNDKEMFQAKRKYKKEIHESHYSFTSL